MKRVLVTGATGFVAQTLIPELRRQGFEVRGAVRNAPVAGAALAEVDWVPDWVPVGDIGPETDWRQALVGVDAVVHLAARVHVMRDHAADPLEAFRRVNREGTRRLAEQAAAAGVRRLAFLSSVKAMAEDGAEAEPLTEALSARPDSPYGWSKQEAEDALLETAAKTGLEAVIFRPPLVYGPGVKGNFLSLLKLCRLGVPLPFGAIANRRSFIYVGNLADALICGLRHEKAAGEIFLTHDGAALSTADLIRMLRRMMGLSAGLAPVPPQILRRMAKWAGREAAWRRLEGSLEIDDRKFRSYVDWRPPFTTEAGMLATVSWFLQNRAASRN